MISNYNNSCSVCITCCDRDVHMLEFAFSIISLQTSSFYELIVSANGLPKNYFDKKPKYIFVSGKKIPIRYYVYPQKKNPGFARNFGAIHCKTEYIMFCDVDDASFDFRLEFALKCIKEHQPDCFLHAQLWHYKTLSFTEGETEIQKINQHNNVQQISKNLETIFTDPELFMQCQNKPKKPIFEEISKTDVKIYSEQALGTIYTRNRGKVPVAYGHPVVKVDTLINNKYDETLKIGEDIVFLHNLHQNKKKIMYCPTVLLIHRAISFSSTNYDIIKFKSNWRVDDDFRKEYLQNRLDKGLNIYHSFDHEPKQEEFEPINPE